MIIRLLVGLRRFNPIWNCSWNTYHSHFCLGRSDYSWGQVTNPFAPSLDMVRNKIYQTKSWIAFFAATQVLKADVWNLHLYKKCFMMENRLSQENVTPAWACSDHRTPSSDTVTGKRKFPWMIIFRIDFSYRDNCRIH